MRLLVKKLDMRGGYQVTQAAAKSVIWAEPTMAASPSNPAYAG
jgi:hypothetical protein